MDGKNTKTVLGEDAEDAMVDDQEDKEKRDRLKIHLTKSIIEAATYEGYGGHQYSNGSYSKVVLWDDREQGLGLRLLPSGSKKWLIWYRNSQKKEKLFTLGDFRTLSVDEARKKAKRKRAEADDGQDPVEERKTAAQGITFAEAAQRYLADYAWKKSSVVDDVSRLNNYLLPAFGARLFRDITKQDVMRLHLDIGREKPHTANRVLALMSVVFNQTVNWGLLPEDARNPTLKIEKFPEDVRTRVLTLDEAARLLAAVDEEEDARFKIMVRMYLHLGIRKSELLKLQWSNVLFDSQNLVFTKTKNKRDHPLKPPKHVWDLFQELYELRDENNPYVFPGESKTGHLMDIRRPWRRARARAGMRDVTLHDLRRSFATWLGELNLSAHSIQVLMNHKNIATSQHYVHMGARQTEEPLRLIGEHVALAEARAKLLKRKDDVSEE